MSCKYLLLTGADTDQEALRLLPNQTYKVGRNADTNDMVIPNDSVSGYHARIEPGKLRPLCHVKHSTH